MFEKQRKGKEQSFNVGIREQQLMLSSSAGVLEDLKKKAERLLYPLLTKNKCYWV